MYETKCHPFPDVSVDCWCWGLEYRCMKLLEYAFYVQMYSFLCALLWPFGCCCEIWRDWTKTLLDEKGYHSVLSFDSLASIKNSTNKLLDMLRRQNMIITEVLRQLRQTNATFARFYGLPNVHKQDTPLRPMMPLWHPLVWISKMTFGTSQTTPASTGNKCQLWKNFTVLRWETMKCWYHLTENHGLKLNGLTVIDIFTSFLHIYIHIYMKESLHAIEFKTGTASFARSRANELAPDAQFLGLRSTMNHGLVRTIWN